LEAPSAEAAITALGTWIQGLTEQGQTGLDAPSAEALDLITRSAGQESLRQLHRHVGVSERSLERRFKTSIGLGPKRYARICRFKAALRDLQQGRFTQLTTLAYSHGYTDQSHFIREFRQFTGLTPGQYPSAMADMHQRLSRMA
jgi:AraC-like DNA-binding protein